MIRYLVALSLVVICLSLLVGLTIGAFAAGLQAVCAGEAAHHIFDTLDILIRLKFFWGVVIIGAFLLILGVKRVCKARRGQGGNWMPVKYAKVLRDDPLSVADADLLGRAATEELLANHMVSRVSPVQSGRILVSGKWGDGKTSVLTRALARVLRMDGAPVIAQFDAWKYVNRKDLSFCLYAEAARASFTECRYRRAMAYWALAIRTTPFGQIQHGGLDRWIVSALFWVFRIVMDPHADFRKSAENQRVHTLLVIDDLDRLPYRQICQILYSVAAIGNMPGVNYVVLADANILASALGRANSTNGLDYLERLFPVHMHLPRPNREVLRRMLFERLAEIHEHLNLVYNEKQAENITLALKYLSNPRSVVRLVNEVSSVLYRRKMEEPTLRRAFHLGDLIDLSALRIYEPDVYENIYRYRHQLMALTYSGDSKNKFEPNDLLDMLMPQVKDIMRQDDLLVFMREHLSYYLNGEGNTYEYRIDVIKADLQLRLSSPRCFLTYFESGAGEMALFKTQEIEFRQVISRGVGDIVEYLLNMSQQMCLLPFLYNLNNIELSSFARKDVQNLLSALIKLLDENLGDEARDDPSGVMGLRRTSYDFAAQLFLACIHELRGNAMIDAVNECIAMKSLNAASTLLIVGKTGDAEDEYALAAGDYRRLLLAWMREVAAQISARQEGGVLPNERELMDHWRIRAYDIRMDSEEKDPAVRELGNRCLMYFLSQISDCESAMRFVKDCQGWLDRALCPDYFRPIGLERLESTVGVGGIKAIVEYLKENVSAEKSEKAVVLVLEDYLKNPESKKGPKAQAAFVRAVLG